MKKKMQSPRANFLPKDQLTPREIENIKRNYQQVINHPGVLAEDKAFAVKRLEKIS